MPDYTIDPDIAALFTNQIDFKQGGIGSCSELSVTYALAIHAPDYLQSTIEVVRDPNGNPILDSDGNRYFQVFLPNSSDETGLRTSRFEIVRESDLKSRSDIATGSDWIRILDAAYDAVLNDQGHTADKIESVMRQQDGDHNSSEHSSNNSPFYYLTGVPDQEYYFDSKEDFMSSFNQHRDHEQLNIVAIYHDITIDGTSFPAPHHYYVTLDHVNGEPRVLLTNPHDTTRPHAVAAEAFFDQVSIDGSLQFSMIRAEDIPSPQQMEAFKAQYRLSGRPEMLHAEDIERTIKAQEIVGIINDWMDVWGGGDAKTSASLSFGGVMDEEALTGSRYFIAKSDISDRFCLIRETKDVAGDPLWEHLYIEPGMFGDHIQFDGVWTQEVEGYSNPIAVSPTALFASLGITVQPKSYPDDTVLRYTVEPRESLYPGLEALYQEVESREHANSQRLMGITYEGETEIGKIHAPILFSSTPQSSHLAV